MQGYLDGSQGDCEYVLRASLETVVYVEKGIPGARRHEAGA